MPFQILGAVASVAVELVPGLSEDRRPRLLRPPANNGALAEFRIRAATRSLCYYPDSSYRGERKWFVGETGPPSFNA